MRSSLGSSTSTSRTSTATRPPSSHSPITWPLTEPCSPWPWSPFWISRPSHTVTCQSLTARRATAFNPQKRTGTATTRLPWVLITWQIENPSYPAVFLHLLESDEHLLMKLINLNNNSTSNLKMLTNYFLGSTWQMLVEHLSSLDWSFSCFLCCFCSTGISMV